MSAYLTSSKIEPTSAPVADPWTKAGKARWYRGGFPKDAGLFQASDAVMKQCVKK